jgi:hypothetical protein
MVEEPAQECRLVAIEATLKEPSASRKREFVAAAPSEKSYRFLSSESGLTLGCRHYRIG